ncbi:VirB4 family type IV secretion system protein [Vibrio sp. 10N.261.45.A4]|uniref:VirB4 family type IV secretion system protein n=1 Tax=Vibrio sp. 10N.261.45.A4 TaxID=3229655 RepID=UPI0035508851
MEAANEMIATYGAVNENTALTYQGGVLGAIELSGVEPALLDAKDKTAITGLLRNVIQRLPFDITLSQYYFHQAHKPLVFKEREHARSQLVSSRRAQFLNEKRDLYQSHLFWVVELHSLVNYADIGGDFITLVLQSVFDKEKREILKQSLSYRGATLLEERELIEQVASLDATLDSLSLSVSFCSLDNQRLTSGEIFNLQKALISLEPRYLNQEARQSPSFDWDVLLATVDAEMVMIEGTHYLKVNHEQPIYARIAAVQGVGTAYTPECAWASEFCPVLEKGNYLLFTRFTPYSKQKKKQMVSRREDDIYRDQTKVTDWIKGEAGHEVIQRRLESNSHLKSVMADLERMGNDGDIYGVWCAYVVLFDTDIPRLVSQTKTMNALLENSDFHLLWETVGLSKAYQTLLLGYNGSNHRACELNASQAAALSLFFRSNEGFPTFSLGDRQEEALYVFESDDGVPFHYTPFIGDKCLVIGVGPTRSGKTFLKQCVANHFRKLGGRYCALDIDAGSEPLAHFFKEDAGLFCLKEVQSSRGFNPFVMSTGQGDDAFVRHMLTLVRLMLLENEAVSMQTLTATEQAAIEEAITHTMAQQGKLRCFSAMLGKCPPSLHEKLAKFKRGGIYGNLFDNDEDAIGALDKPYSVYNTQGVKDSPSLAQLVNTEIFFRSVRLFEGAQYRTTPKFFEIDECQYVLSQPGAAEFAIAKARTWFKHGGGMGFWTQSPKHYSDLKEWSTLRSAATTFWFMADPEMERSEYQKAFPMLKESELDAIEKLIPKQQAFIKQPDKGIAKVVNLFVEPEQYVIATSRPHESALAQKIFAEEEDVDVAIARLIQEIEC